MRVLATAGGRDISLLIDNNGRSETMTFDHVAFPLVPFSNMSQVGNACLSSSSTTWFREPLLTRAPSHLLTTARLQEITAPTPRIAEQSGALFGVIL